MAAMERSLLALLFLLFVGAAFVWPSWRVWRRTGQNPYVLPSSEDAHGFIASGFRVVMLALLAYVLAQALWPELDGMLGTLHWLSHPLVRLSGWAGLVGALAWTVLAQYQMGVSWRIGLDHRNRTALVTTGVFAVSRNPVFLGMRISLLSLVLLQANVVTIAAALVADVFMQMQVRLEEAFLAQQHGPAYAAYRHKTRRWL